MRSFMIASCLLAIAVAAPQGYNYAVGSSSNYQPGISSGFGNSFTSGSGFGGGSGAGFGGGSGAGFGGGSIGGFGGGSVSGFGGGSGAGFGGGSGAGFGGGSGASFGGDASGIAFNSFNPAPALPSASSVAAIHKARPHGQRRVLPAIVSKNVYFHAAADEPDEEIYEDNSTEQQRKHYNVVFIKAPSQSVKKIATQTAQALNEERTAIYVLSKKNDISEVRQAISSVPHKPAKPDVFFIKYKTPEEAQHAQQTIQAQYDSLGGATSKFDEGYAPISSVIGALGDGSHGGQTGHNGQAGHGGFISGGSNGGFVSGGNGGFVSGSNGGFASDSFIGSGSNAGSIAAQYLPPNKF